MITERQKEILQHMLGADDRYFKKQWGFRNHFFCSIPSNYYDNLMEMEKDGLVFLGKSFGDYSYFHATKKGAKAIGFKDYQLRKVK